MKISSQLGLGFGALLFSTAILALSSVGALRSMLSGFQVVSNDVWPKISIANQNIQAAYDYSRAFFFIASFESRPDVDPDALRKAHLILVETVKLVNDNVATLETLVRTDQEKKLLEIVKTRRVIYNTSRIEVLEKKKKGEDEKALYLLGTDTNNLQTIYIQSWKDFIALENDLFNKNVDNSITIYHFEKRVLIGVFIAELIAGLLIAALIIRNLYKSLGGEPNYAAWIVAKISSGDFSEEVHTKKLDDSSLLYGMKKMTMALRSSREKEYKLDWLKSGMNELNNVLRGGNEAVFHFDDDEILNHSAESIFKVAELAEKALTYIAERLKAGVAALYLFDSNTKKLQLTAGFATTNTVLDEIELGSGIVGQAGLQRKILTLSDVPEDCLVIESGLLKTSVRYIVALPLIYSNNLIGVIELGLFRTLTDIEMDFLVQLQEVVGVSLNVSESRKRMQTLLIKNNKQTIELTHQQEKLTQSNDELKQRAEMLEVQREQIQLKNREVEEASREIQKKAAEVERVSAYKSEFLANMSHELRTPLNSILILSSLLKKNGDGKLSQKQVEYASTINGAGTDLLNLINDILDLSKIEAGYLELSNEEIAITDIIGQLERLFRPVAEHKKVKFAITLAKNVPETIYADGQRVQQIIKNLLSNAFKFTDQGEVALRIQQSNKNIWNSPRLEMEVTDTGIGISEDKYEQIFNAFQQADGSTSRKYGGTGLGLSISRQLAQRMGGDIGVKSKHGQGSSFTLYLPFNAKQDLTPIYPSNEVIEEKIGLKITHIEDDRGNLRDGQLSILIIEDDYSFAGILRDLVREQGFSAIVATDGETGLNLADQYVPTAIILDVMLPHLDGWGVMQKLKEQSRTSQIPVHFITCIEDFHKAFKMGAVGFVTKPINSEQLEDVIMVIKSAIAKSGRQLLVVEKNEVEAKCIASLLESNLLSITIARSGAEALHRLKQGKFDCMVLDLGITDMSGVELLDDICRQNLGIGMPVIIHTGCSLTREEEQRLHKYSTNIIVKGVQSQERLLNDVSLFLQLIDNSPIEIQNQTKKIEILRETEEISQFLNYRDDKQLDSDAQEKNEQDAELNFRSILKGRKVLLVDDDMRNIFSMSNVLDDVEMNIISATNGFEALEILEESPDIEIVLMDIMMPDMDGYEAMRRIRMNSNYSELTIIAMTAKAMTGDKQLCIDAGATDYISKPIDIDLLLEKMTKLLM